MQLVTEILRKNPSKSALIGHQTFSVMRVASRLFQYDLVQRYARKDRCE